MTLFDPGPIVVTDVDPEEVLRVLAGAKPLSAGQKLTLRNRALLASGVHPITRKPLREGRQTCGSCAHHVVHRHDRTWHKCDLNATRGAATDLRVSWPACTAWEDVS